MSLRIMAVLLAFLLVFAAATPASGAGTCSGISEASGTALTTVRVVSGLVKTLFVGAPPEDFDRLFVVEQDGRIRILRDGALLPAAFLDIAAIVRSPADGAGNEEGLLGLAFHPAYATNGWFFVYYTNTSGNNVVARYTVSADPNVADAASRVEVIAFSHPGATNHNGGMIAFGPSDGKLYIGTGDGGGACDTANNSQTLASRQGKLHRIDVDALPYTIPVDNPYAGGVAGDDEVWSSGLRNPFRWSFDRETGDLYIGDVGQGKWEEINWQAAPDAGKARNFGWRNYEGTECPNPSCGNVGSCTIVNNTLPVLQYLNQAAPECSVTGGYVYRGCRIPALHGTYFYSDYCTAFIRTFRMVGGAVTDQQVRTGELAPGGGLAINLVTSFGEDGRGEMYVVDQGGEVFKIVPVLPSLEVSGRGAESFRLARDGDWTWENLQTTSSHPIAAYKIYRSNGSGSGMFDCIRQQAGTVWVGGDLQEPPADEMYAYLVTALNAAGTASSPGTRSDGGARTLSPTACP